MSCSSSFFLDETRSSSPWICARTPLGPSSLMIFEIFFASSCEMPSLRLVSRRYSLPDSFGSPASRTLSETPRLISFSLNRSSTAFARSSLFALISTALSPGPGDGRSHAAEVEPGADLLGCLVQRVVDFLTVDLRHDVE